MGISPAHTLPSEQRAGGIPTMSASNSSTLGACPDCRAVVTASDVLIEYEVDGQREAFAECPQCGEVVSPV